jgi:hypothetical protein
MTPIQFRSTEEPDLFAFTDDSTGSNLPEELGPWQQSTENISTQVYAVSILDGLASFDPITKAVERYGFYLIRSDFIDPTTS